MNEDIQEFYNYKIICENCGKRSEGQQEKGKTRPEKALCSECGCPAQTYSRERIVVA